MCEKFKRNIHDRWLLCCVLCKNQYHIECTSASKLFYLMSEAKKANWKCNPCSLKGKSKDDDFYTPPLMNSPPPIFQSPQWSTPQNFVTKKEKVYVNIPTENTFSILSSGEEHEEMHDRENDNCILQRSCPELTITDTDDMKDIILKLQSDLASTEQEIENLLSENFTPNKIKVEARTSN